jgi:erythritol transport system permease protein
MSSEALPSAKVNRSNKRRPLALLLMSFRTFIALIVVFTFFGVTTPNFLDVPTLIIVAKHVAVNAILAIGMTFVILTAGIDLSVGSIVGISGMVAGTLLTRGIPLSLFDVTIFPNVFETIAIALAVGAGVGLINGLLITRLNVAPFIATLGTLYVARGAALLISDGATFSNLVGDARFENNGFPFLGSGTIAGVPVSIVALGLFAAVAAYVAARTPFGRHVYAVGGNERAAALSGVRVDRVKVLAYMISGCCAAFAGLVIASELVAAHPASGETFELNAIAAAVLGGTSLSGGRGTIAGTLVGAFVIGVLSDGLVMLGVSSFWQMVIKGLVIIAAVVLDQMQRRMYRRFALEAQLE